MAHADEPRLGHLQAMTDDTGLIQHAIGAVPDPRTGYTTDDNARALLAMVRLWRNAPERRAESEPLLRRYLSFLLWVQVTDGERAGWFINEVGYDRSYLDAYGTEDCLGRTTWALGEALGGPLPEGVRIALDRLWSRTEPAAATLTSPRACAYALLGLCVAPDPNPAVLRRLADVLEQGWATYAHKDWRWFEHYLTYDNARMVEATLRVGRALDDPRLVAIGHEAATFLTAHSFLGETLMPVGNAGWFALGASPARFDQQTVEAGAYVELYRLLGDRARADAALGWFLGRNVHRLPVLDSISGGCGDAITAVGVNQNQGAEATLSYLLAALSG
jgi:hypothetical protein